MTNKELTELKKIEGATSLTAKHVMDLVQMEREKLADKYYQDGFKKGYDEGLANGKSATPPQEDTKREASETPVMDFVEWYNHKTLSMEKVEKIIPLRVVEVYLTQQSKEVES